MTSLLLKGFQQLLQDQTAVMQGRSRVPLDFSEGAVLRAIIEANGGIGLWLQSEMLKVLSATRASTSTGSDLDSWVQDFGLTRLGSSAAQGTVTFSRFSPSSEALIPVGATVETLDGTQDFAVIADTSNVNFNVGLNGYVLAAGIASIDVPIRSVAPGIGGNVGAGTIGVITSSIFYVDQVANAAPITGGGDQESDAALRARFISYIQSLSRGTPPALQFAATSAGLGLQASVMENVNQDGTPNDGFVSVTVAASSANPIVDAATFARASGNVDAYRAAGVWVGVFQPIIYYVYTVLNIDVADGYDRNDLIAQVAETVDGYINSRKLGETLNITRIAQVAYGVSAGVINVFNVTINGDALDYPAGKPNIIRSSGVSVS